jgi:hypothetical protein
LCGNADYCIHTEIQVRQNTVNFWCKQDEHFVIICLILICHAC